MLGDFNNLLYGVKSLKAAILNKLLLVGLISMAVGFLFGTPYTLLDFKTFLPFLTGHIAQAQAGWLTESPVENYYIEVITDFLKNGMGIFLLALCLLSLLYGVYCRTKADILVLSFPLIYYLINGSSKLNFSRYWNPVLPFLVLLWVRFLYDGVNKICKGVRLQNIFLILIPLLLTLSPIYQSIRFGYLISQKDTRTLAKEWIEKNIPAGTKIALDKEGPQIYQNKDGIYAEYLSQVEEGVKTVEGRSYKLTPAEPIGSKKQYYELLLQMPVSQPNYYAIRESTVANKTLEFYETNGFKYIVVVEGLRRVVLSNPGEYPIVAHFFKSLESKYSRVKEFRPNRLDTPGPIIYVYKIDLND